MGSDVLPLERISRISRIAYHYRLVISFLALPIVIALIALPILVPVHDTRHYRMRISARANDEQDHQKQ
jgi:hypothetical protein